ncbi:class I SAM-dependent methyltransferase [Bradyrhizobium sp. 186]|uniref:class I SAM-dependent methyltransferase n=1 Tax=Bradyrhizobium sp. 186 TaxID=2782654 RepID=UPI0020014AF9|nr:class I SAM-dependent methyltransferase [Bradyrhizobium sp. 186]UPK39394.1 class I SAM-dependent methyltransferase [Bradyrhizobium sp. 186]
MTEPAKGAAYCFDDGTAYERFMGRWSHGAGEVFLKWLAPAPGACWLDVGCGTGSFTQLIVDRCAPSAVFAIDPEQAQISHARHRPAAQQVDFRVGDALALPFTDRTFDIVASGLVLNFVSNPDLALSEMRRVARKEAMVGAYVWDFAADLSPTWPFRQGLRELGALVAPTPGAEGSSLSGLNALFERAGLNGILTRIINVTMRFSDFEDFWTSQTPSFNPIARQIAGLETNERTRLVDAVRAKIVRPDGSVEYVARANAVRGKAPG